MDTIKFNKGNVKMVAHQGLSGLEQGNTNPAFVAAGNRSYFGIETDIHVTKDKKFVVIHNETTEAVSGGKYNINVEENDFAATADVVLPDKDGSLCRRDIRIPSLEEYISICKKYDKICVLELKNHFEEEDLVRLTEEIRRLDYLHGMIFISFDLPNCLNTRKLLPESKIQLLLREEKPTAEQIQIMRDNRLDLDIYYTALDAPTVELLHANGIEINCWTCDTKEEAEHLAALGVDYITSNILE